MLSKASVKWNEGAIVPVRLSPEPTTPKDSQAIAFEQIGYVIREVLDSVHYGLSESKISSVEFDWIKYIHCLLV